MDTDFTLDDLRKQIQNIQKMGLKNLIGQMPGMAETVREGEDPGAALLRVQHMIDAMTPEEQTNPDIIDEARRTRIAAGASVPPDDVCEFLKRFHEFRAVRKQMMNMSAWECIKLVLGIRRFPLPPPPPRPEA